MNTKDLIVVSNGGFVPAKKRDDIREKIAYIICKKSDFKFCLRELIYSIYVTDRQCSKHHFDSYAESTVKEIVDDLLEDMDEQSIEQFLFMASFYTQGYDEWLEDRMKAGKISEEIVKLGGITKMNIGKTTKNYVEAQAELEKHFRRKKWK